MKVAKLVDEYKTRLSISDFASDVALNGLQCGDLNAEVKKVAFAVDACQSTIDQAIAANADMLFVHHGLFWGEMLAITGTHYARVRAMITHHLSLFACHIPLDAHPVFGNNAQMALRMGMTGYDPFGTFRGMSIGFKGALPFPMSAPELARLLGFTEADGLTILPFGKDMNESVGIISGGAGDDLPDAIASGLDCFITGDIGHERFHMALENHINVISGGHYRSEVFGVKAMMRLTESALGLETVFIDHPTGL